MMILGMGLDVTEIRRVRDTLARHGERFTNRVLTQAEAGAMPGGDAAAYVAARFAAKEACAKALGTGFAEGVTMKDIEVLKLPSGAPVLALSGRAGELAQAMGVTRLHLSLTHGRDIAAAVVVLEGSPPPQPS